MMRPSNSGIATLIAVSRAVRPRCETSHASRGIPLVTAWTTGTPMRSKTDGSLAADVSPSANDSVEIATSHRPIDEPQSGWHAVGVSARAGST